MRRFFHRRHISPSARAYGSLLLGATLLAAFWFAAYFFALDDLREKLGTISIAFSVLVSVLLILDLYGALFVRRIECERRVANSVAVNRWFDVVLTLRHNFASIKQLEVFDAINSEVDYEHMPLTLHLEPGRYAQLRYRLRARERGPLELSGLYLRLRSPFGFWRTQYFQALPAQIKVFPDFSAITAYTILATDNHVSQLGIKRQPRRGQGLDFMQLRDYRRGDSLRQIDWKATSRRQKIISKEYQDERDQQIVLLIDSGRRMRAQDDKLNHFDHALNAALLVSYIALRQGDCVGVMAFGREYRWLAPQKSAASMKVILNGLYDLQTTATAPDYLLAAEKLCALQSKRSLIILVTNTRDEDVDEVRMAVKLLQKKHLVVLANIREQVLDTMQAQEVHNLEGALSYAAASHHLTARRETQRSLSEAGVLTLDCLARELPVRVANSYLEIKRAGVL